MAFTIQSDQVRSTLQRFGHATNLELHEALLVTMPRFSVQSVHRITARLLERGEIGLAPSDGRNVVLDARPDVHDHFVCTSCGGVIDLELPDNVITSIQSQLGRNLVHDGITIRGRCENCSTIASAAITGEVAAINH